MLPESFGRRTGAVVLVVLFGAALTLLPAQAWAQNCADQAAPAQGASAVTTLVLLETNGCLGGDNDPTALASAVRRALHPAIAADAPPANPYAAALALLIAHTAGAHTSGDPALFSELARHLDDTHRALGTFKAPDLPEFWRLTQGTGKVVTGSLHARVTSACGAGGATCTAAFDSVREAVRIIALARLTLQRESSPIARAHLDATARRLRQWGAYFDTARSQYLWELAINGRLMKDTRPKDASGVSQGFRDVPSMQMLVLHADIALEFNNGAPAGKKLEPVAVIDVIGINRWRWNADGGMGRAVGASVIASIGDKASGHVVGWGAMIHFYHRYSVGFTFRRGGEKAVVVTSDFARLWNKVPPQVRERIAGGK